jgi:aspartate-semialdehyde dehydrogenase
MQPQNKIEVGVLGATGMVGQQFAKLLQNHPWFDLKWVGASDRSAGKKYRDATTWRLNGVMPAGVADLTVEDCKPGSAPRLVFSSMDASVATEIEQAFARAGHVVVSNSRNHRMELDVPLVIPEVNPSHLKIIPIQQRRRGWSGQIATNSNCSTMVLALALAPLKQFGIRRVLVTTMQAISGAGYPGVASLDINANVIPFIGSEEEKMQQETQKILGEFTGDALRPLAAQVSAHCNRVPVVDGHMVATSIELERGLPTAPPQPVIYMSEPDRPQPRRDVEREHGMAVFIGRLRPCPVLGTKFMALGHNTVRGAAGAAILNAELMYSEGLLD